MKKLVNIKAMMGNDVYIPLSATCELLELSEADVKKEAEVVDIAGMGRFVTEDDFNKMLQAHPADGVNIQFTKVQSLEVAAQKILELYPLKRVFAEKMFRSLGAELGLTADEYIAQTDFPAELEKARKEILESSSVQAKIQHYRESYAEFFEYLPDSILKKYGLEIQQFTILSREAGPDIMTFLAGDGIFYQCYMDCGCADCWEDSYIDDNGRIVIPSADYPAGYYTLARETDRDFRKFTAIENVLFCVQNIPAENDWQDYLDFKNGGVYLSLNMHAIMKILNPANCPGEYWFNGIPETEKD